MNRDKILEQSRLKSILTYGKRLASELSSSFYEYGEAETINNWDISYDEKAKKRCFSNITNL